MNMKIPYKLKMASGLALFFLVTMALGLLIVGALNLFARSIGAQPVRLMASLGGMVCGYCGFLLARHLLDFVASDKYSGR